MLLRNVCILTCFVGCPTAMAAKVNLQVSNYPPYVEEKSSRQGVITQIVVEALKSKRVKSTVHFNDWIEVENQVDNHKALSFMWTKTKARLKKWHFSDPIYIQRKKFVSADNFSRNINYLHNLRGLKIGFTRFFTYGNQIENFRQKLTITEHDSDFLAVQALVKNQVDLVAMDEMTAAYWLNQSTNKSGKRFKFINTPHFDSVSYFVVCSKSYGNCLNHIKKFNQGLAIIQKDGTSKSLLNRAESVQQ
ncbi:MAG: transporter substrate-binding domain-containing protein [Algicola sp.]|nr:transporter substrate-binding domain-containing protein [Algicola sp.]